jgi:large subunit ribosomal protein L21
MYAIVQVGASQYKVSRGDAINVDKIVAKKRKSITLDKVLLFKDKKEIKVGQPYIKDVKVTADILGDFKANKVISFKYRRRKSSRWKKGHRQQLTRLQIKEIISK